MGAKKERIYGKGGSRGLHRGLRGAVAPKMPPSWIRHYLNPALPAWPKDEILIIASTNVKTNPLQVVVVTLLSQGPATFFVVRTGSKLKCFRGPIFKKPQMFSN